MFLSNISENRRFYPIAVGLTVIIIAHPGGQVKGGSHLLPPPEQGERRGVISPVIWASCIEPGKLFAVDFIGKRSGVRLGTYPTAKEAQEAANAYGRMKCTDFAAMICRKEA